MNISTEILLNGACTMLLIGALARVIYRAFNRLEEKMDEYIKEHAACRAIMASHIGREEFNHALERVNGRLDDQAERVASLEVAVGK